MSWIFIVCLACNLFLFGVTCFVQIVHYPSFVFIKTSEWRSYHEFHSARTGYVVLLPIILQLVSTPFLGFYSYLLYFFTALSVGVTAFVSMPIHRHLSKGFTLKGYKSLVISNWLRVVGWGGASAVLLLRIYVSGEPR